jgi:magnesium transporter
MRLILLLGFKWVDISGTTEEDARYLEEGFHFHHLAVEDCLQTAIHPPKIDDFGDYLFIIIHGINYAAVSEEVETGEFVMFLGRHFVVTNHNFPTLQRQRHKAICLRRWPTMKRGPDFLAHSLADILIYNVLPTIDKLTEIAGEIEEETIRNPHQEIL